MILQGPGWAYRAGRGSRRGHGLGLTGDEEFSPPAPLPTCRSEIDMPDPVFMSLDELDVRLGAEYALKRAALSVWG